MPLSIMISFMFLIGALCGSSIAAPNQRIVSGVIADVGQYPYMVSLRDGNNHFCGGSIVNNNWVLTSATCAVNRTSFQIVVGTNTLNSGGDTYASSTIIIHSLFDPVPQNYDVAVVKTTTPIVYSAKVIPILLSYLPPIANAVVVESGWGQVNSGSFSLSNDLLALNTTYISKTSCQNKLAGLPVSLQASQICTYKPSAGACSFDDGSPLAMGNKQVGIVLSYGCEQGYPDVFTSISFVYFWIKNNTAMC